MSTEELGLDDGHLLDLLAEQAPEVPADFPGRMLAMGRRARVRRTVLAGTVAATAVTVTAGAGVIAYLHTGPGTAGSSTAVHADPVAGPYAASIRALADQMRAGSSRTWKVLYIEDHTCRDVLSGPDNRPCAMAPLSRRLRDDLGQALRTYAPVAFISDPATVTVGRLPQVADGGLLVRLGTARITGSSALVPLSVWWNLQSGQGLTYRLTENGGRWKVVRATGSAWIS